MATQQQLDDVYMTMAEAMATLSYARRTKVGAVAVTQQGVVITGTNGMPKALGNVLERKKYKMLGDDIEYPLVDGHKRYHLVTELVTKDEVIHAECNIITKAAREGVSLIGSTVYTTLSPCAHCASMLLSVGVKRVVFSEYYRDKKGLDVLQQGGCSIHRLIDLE